jgi:hypothetical protein
MHHLCPLAEGLGERSATAMLDQRFLEGLKRAGGG